MAKKRKKRRRNSLLGLGLQTGVSSVAVNVLPPNPVSPQVSKGFTEFAGFFPTFGKLKGAELVIRGTSGVIKATKKLKPKKKRKRK